MATPHDSTLEQDIGLRVPAIQDLFVQLLETRCGEGDVGISAICRELGVHRKLAWQVRNVAYTPDPFRAVGFMPSKAGIEALVSAINRVSSSKPISDRLVEAFQGFEELVEVHAGDRTNLEMLVESNPSSPKRDAEAKWREKAFLGNSFIWGAQAKTQHSISILHPSDTKENWFDIVQIRGLIGLKRVRPNTRWLVNQSVVLSGPDVQSHNRIPLDEEAASRMDGVPVIPEFCSDPLPRLVRRPAQDLVNDELLPGPVGSTGQQTIVTGEWIRELAPVHRIQEGQRAHFGAVCRTPSEVFIYDHFVHRDLFPDVERELCVFSELNAPITKDETDLLPISETIEHLGQGMHVARTPDVPGYMKMLTWTFGKLGWDAREFDVHRIRIAFPPMPSTVMIRHELPDPERLGRDSEA